MVVGVVVSSNMALALAVPHQRFAMSVDALTLRLFNKVRLERWLCRARALPCPWMRKR